MDNDVVMFLSSEQSSVRIEIELFLEAKRRESRLSVLPGEFERREEWNKRKLNLQLFSSVN